MASVWTLIPQFLRQTWRMAIKLKSTVCNTDSSPVTIVVLICTVYLRHVLEASCICNRLRLCRLCISQSRCIELDCSVRVEEEGGISIENNNEHTERNKTT